MKYEIRELREGDLAYLSWNLRADDVMELYAAHGHFDTLKALEYSAMHSTELLIGEGEGKPVMILGMTPFARAAFIWAVATPDIKKFRLPLMRNSRPMLKGWFEKHQSVDYMFNFTYAENTLHHQWLEWCGATLLPEVPMGKLGKAFKPFTIRREIYV